MCPGPFPSCPAVLAPASQAHNSNSVDNENEIPIKMQYVAASLSTISYPFDLLLYQLAINFPTARPNAVKGNVYMPTV